LPKTVSFIHDLSTTRLKPDIEPRYTNKIRASVTYRAWTLCLENPITKGSVFN
jgi:hypothetical protein